MVTASVTICVAPAKAEKWSLLLQRLVDTMVCEPTEAAKHAGRLGFAVSLAADKVGRAFVKPFHAQANAPMKGGKVSLWLVSAAQWFIAYLRDFEPRRFVAGRRRRQIRLWTDAAGASRRLAAVLWTGECWYYTVYTVPQTLWDQFLPREDNQIGMQELLAFPLAVLTFADLLEDTLGICFIHNDGVLSSLLKGSNTALDANLCVGQIWLDLTRLKVGMLLARVESGANVADAPSRDEFSFLTRVKAVFRKPIMPQ
jgi:hypothetical protein